MKNFYKSIAIIAKVAVIVCMITACGDGGKGKTVTFSLDKIDTNSFSITVEGDKWLHFTYDTYKAGELVQFPNFTANAVDENNEDWRLSFYSAFPPSNWKRINDNVITATFNSDYTITRMEIEFAYPQSVAFAFRASKLLLGGDFDDNYQINPSKSSLRWE
jgi:hypothetical protein